MENKTKVNVSTTDIRQYIKDEYKRCSIDPIHFIRNHIFIQTQDKGIIKFSLFDFQEQALKDIHANDRSIILKSRQMGISTLISAYCLWQLIFHDGKNILIVSIKEGTAKEIVAKIRLANEKLPTYLKLKELENNKLSIKFKNNSMVQAVSSASSAGRSFSASLIILDEAAFIENVEELWLSIQPTLSTTKEGKAIILSTPRGMGNFFHKTWTDSENKRNEFFKIKLPWNLRPDRDESWKAKQMLELGAKDFGQEYDCDFLSSGNSLIALDLLQWYEKELCKDPIELRYGGGLWIFKYPDYSKDYVVTADSGRGDATDYSAFHVFEIETMEQVAEYKDQIGTKEYGNLLVNVAAEYNNALLIVERENIGWAVLQQIIDRDYQNTFYSSTDLKYVDVKRQLSSKYYRDDQKLLPGFSTTTKTRPLIISKIEIYFREKAITPRSIRLINELRTFVWVNGKAQAASGYNDDLTISCGIGLWVRDTALRLKQEGISLTRTMINKIHIPKSDNNTPIYTTKMMTNGEEQWSMKTGRNIDDKESLIWLLR